MESLHVCQQQSSLWKCFRALRTLAGLQLIPMLVCSVLLILPFHVKNLMAFFTGKAPARYLCFHIHTGIPFRIEQKDLLLHMKLLMLVKLSQGSKGFVTDGTEKLHPSGRLWRRLHWKNTSAWALQVWFQLLTEIPSWHVFFLQTPLSCLQLILRFWCHCRVTLGFFQISASNLKKMIPLRHKNHKTRIKPRIRRMKPQFGKVWFSTVVNTPERYLFFGFTRYYTIF